MTAGGIVLLVALSAMFGGLVGYLVTNAVQQRRIHPGGSGDGPVAPQSADRADDAEGSPSAPRTPALQHAIRDDGTLGPLGEAVEGIEHGIVIADGRGEVVYRNRAAARLAAARHGHSLVEDCVRRMLTGAREHGSCSETVELFGPPAELFMVSAHPFVEDSGTGALAVVEDRSDIRRTETVRRDFVANISHELKTPIGALGLLAETIEAEDDPQVMRRLAARMVSESERASNTIDDLLELSRIEFADDAQLDDLEVTQIVSEAVARIANAAEQSGIEVVTEVPDGLRVHGDKRQLVSALFNLLDNAIKYSTPGSDVRVIVHGPDSPDGSLEISVLDHGIGIPRRSIERVFERFYRVDRARSRNTGGTGLGLAIVRHVVSNHGGQVLVESTEGRGSVFTMELPVPSGSQVKRSAPEATST